MLSPLRASPPIASLVYTALCFPSISEGISWIRTGMYAISASSADMRITSRASDLPTSSRATGASTHPLSSALQNVPVRSHDYTDRRGRGRLPVAKGPTYNLDQGRFEQCWAMDPEFYLSGLPPIARTRRPHRNRSKTTPLRARPSGFLTSSVLASYNTPGRNPPSSMAYVIASI